MQEKDKKSSQAYPFPKCHLFYNLLHLKMPPCKQEELQKLNPLGLFGLTNVSHLHKSKSIKTQTKFNV